jgi:ABC-type glycerol-3-phosphate transport system substrate-binding protein
MSPRRVLPFIIFAALIAAGSAWAAPVSLTLWTHTHAPANAYITKLIAAYQSANPGVTIAYEPAADNNTYEDKVLTALASGGGPDIFNEGLSSMYTFAGLGQLAEVTPTVLKAMGYPSLAAFKNDYIPGIIDKLLYQGKLYSVYREFNIFGLMLNKSAFKRAGLDATKDYPKTWGDMLVLAKRLTMWDGDKLVQTGMYLPQWGADWTFIPMQSLFLQNGARVLDSSGKSAVSSPASMKTFAYFRSLARAEDNAPIKYADDVWARFALGDVAMYVASTWTMPLLKDQAKGDARFSPANFMVVPYPKVPGADRVHNPIQALVWSVNAKSDNVDQAWKFVKWMTSGQQAVGWYNDVGYLLPTKAMMDMGKKNADVAKYLDLAKDADVLFANPKYNEIGAAVYSAWQAALTTDNDLGGILSAADRQINDALTQ